MYSKLTKYRKPINGINEPISNARYWDTAYDNFEVKKYKESLLGVLNYINPSLLENKDVKSEKIKISQQHGSALININIDNSGFEVNVPFLKINGANTIPLLRKVVEINFSPLSLAEIILKDNALWFQYSTPLEMCQPNKIYDVLREICVYADKYDDEFIKKYKASFYHEPKVTHLTSDEQDAVWDHLMEISDEYKKHIGYFEEKRWLKLVWDIIVISLFNIANIPCVHGTLRSNTEENIFIMFNGDVEFEYRLDKGKKYLNNLFGNLNKEELFKDLYHVERFISLKYISSVNILQKVFEASKKRIDDELSSGHYATSFLLYVLFAKILFDYNLEDNHKQIICDTLAKAGGEETDKATEIMKDTFDKFLNGTADSAKPKKGFFAKLFG
jgi:hypothetical protein